MHVVALPPAPGQGAFTDGLPLTGVAVIDEVDGTFTLDVASGAGTGLAYVRGADGEVTVSGQWQGVVVQ